MGADPEAPGSLLVASISEAMTRRASNSQASTSTQRSSSSWLVRQGQFQERAGLPLAWAHQSSIHIISFPGDASFKVAPRRQQQLPRQVQHFLNLSPAPAEAAARMAQALQNHVLSRLILLVRVQQALSRAVQTQLDRTSHWRPRNPFRRGRGSADVDNPNARHHHRASRQAQRLYEQGVAAERELNFDEAIRCYEKASATDPASAEYRARLSKALSDQAYVTTTPSSRLELQKRAIAEAEAAVAADPDSALGWVACCVSRGRLALHMDNRTKVALARAAQDDVRKALELDPSNDVAHHLLGRWNYEMASVNAVVRTLIHMLYGQALMAGSYRSAADCFATAVSLRPDYLIHRVELGRALIKLGQREEGLGHLRAAAELDVPDINALLQKADAELMLSKLTGGSGGKQVIGGGGGGKEQQ